MTDNPIHSLEGIDLLLDGDFIVSTRFEAATDADVQAFRVLAEHGEVDVGHGPVFERAKPLVQETNRAVINVQIQLEAGAKENVACVAIVGDARVTERADENGVERSQRLVAPGRDRLASGEKVIRSPRQRVEIDAADSFEDTDSFGNDLVADAVARNDRDTGGHTAQSTVAFTLL